MKIVIEIDCTIEGKWKGDYEGELIDKFALPGIVVIGNDDYGCDVIIESTTWRFQDE